MHHVYTKTQRRISDEQCRCIRYCIGLAQQHFVHMVRHAAVQRSYMKQNRQLSSWANRVLGSMYRMHGI
jgi:hypothetical protein